MAATKQSVAKASVANSTSHYACSVKHVQMYNHNLQVVLECMTVSIKETKFIGCSGWGSMKGHF